MTRNRAYFILMGSAVAMVILAWVIVWRYSATAAVAMSIVAAAIPPVAVIVVNAGDEASRRQ